MARYEGRAVRVARGGQRGAVLPRARHYLSYALGTLVRLFDQAPWQEREDALRHGRALLGVVCGLQYVRAEHTLDLLVAPVMRGRRYSARPIYFSDVVVRRDLAANSFDALKGSRFRRQRADVPLGLWHRPLHARRARK